MANAQLNDSLALPPLIEFEDGSTGLIVFGILGILLEYLGVLLVPVGVSLSSTSSSARRWT